MPNFITAFNERIAIALTRGFGSIWVFYLFIVYGLLPIIPFLRPYQDNFLYWSNFMQLIALPLLLVGTNILGRSAEERAKLDHEKLAQSYDEQVEIYKDIVEMLAKQEAMTQEMNSFTCHHPRAVAMPATKR